MKHLPNLLTLSNLFCGCIAIAYFLTAQPSLSMSLGQGGGLPNWSWVHGAEQMYIGSMFIGIAAVCDLLDGFTARALKINSPIGKDLDSLADVVSFGVAPSVIFFKFLWDAMMQEKNAFDVNMLGMAPAFLLACFAALRLAKFNVTAVEQKSFFIGMPTPAVGMLVASFPLIMWFDHSKISHLVAMAFQNKWVLYLIIALLCWLMVSRVKFFKMIPARWSMPNVWPQAVLVVLTAVSIPFLGMSAILFAFILYLFLSLIYKQPATIENKI
jgi:CDP-diacylglycerol--serine O-phosphatidyltransferase